MKEKKEWQSQEQNRNRTLVEAEADEEHQPSDIHRVANELVGADGDECSRSIKNGGCSSSSGNENARAREHKSCSDDHRDSAGDLGRSRQGDSKTPVKGSHQQRNPAKQKQKAAHVDNGSECEKESLHCLSPMTVSRLE